MNRRGGQLYRFDHDSLTPANWMPCVLASTAPLVDTETSLQGITKETRHNEARQFSLIQCIRRLRWQQCGMAIRRNPTYCLDLDTAAVVGKIIISKTMGQAIYDHPLWPEMQYAGSRLKHKADFLYRSENTRLEGGSEMCLAKSDLMAYHNSQ